MISKIIISMLLAGYLFSPSQAFRPKATPHQYFFHGFLISNDDGEILREKTLKIL